MHVAVYIEKHWHMVYGQYPNPRWDFKFIHIVVMQLTLEVVSYIHKFTECVI